MWKYGTCCEMVGMILCSSNVHPTQELQLRFFTNSQPNQAISETLWLSSARRMNEKQLTLNEARYAGGKTERCQMLENSLATFFLSLPDSHVVTQYDYRLITLFPYMDVDCQWMRAILRPECLAECWNWNRSGWECRNWRDWLSPLVLGWMRPSSWDLERKE